MVGAGCSRGVGLVMQLSHAPCMAIAWQNDPHLKPFLHAGCRTEQTSGLPSGADWVGITSDYSGKRLVAGVYGGYLYIRYSCVVARLWLVL